MKFEVDTREIQSVGEISSKKITLSTNAKAFKIIFGQIYPDIIKAIVRELFANAWDSQKQAENLMTPIDIHLPTTLRPYFTIRDYGTGMSPAVINEIYSKVFESTKDSSDDEVGMFGMGSKTPLGYTDSFSIMSYVDGIFYAYDIYIDTDGHPVISLKATGKTDQPNGVEVSLGVDPDDFETFQTYAEMFALGAGTPININKKRYINQREVAMFGDRWVLFNDNQKAMIRMGCIVYRIDNEYLRSQIINQVDKRRVDDYVALPIVLDFDIGEFQVTGSREDIVYDAASSQKIADRLFEVVGLIREKVNDDIRRSKNIESAYVKHRKYIDSKIIDRYDDKNCYFYKSWNIANIESKFTEKKLRVKFAFNNFSKHSQNIKPFNSRKSFVDLTKLYYPKATTFVLLEYTDVKVSRTRDRINNFIITIRNKGWRVCDPYWSRDKMYNIIHVVCKSTDNLSRLFSVIPERHVIINVEDLVKPVTERSAKINDGETYAFVLNRKDGKIVVSSSHYIIDFNDVKYYVNIDRHRGIENPKNLDIEHVLNTCKISCGKVICINKTNHKLVDKHNLVNIFDHYQNIKDSVDYNDQTYYYNIIKEINSVHNGWFPDDNWNEVLRKRIRDFADVLKFLEAPISQIEIDQVDDGFDPDINQVVRDRYTTLYTQCSNKVDKLYQDQPLMKYVDQYVLRRKFKQILTEIGEM